MRIERDRQRPRTSFPRLLNRTGKNLAMSKMHPIEIADRGNGLGQGQPESRQAIDRQRSYVSGLAVIGITGNDSPS